VPLDVNEAEATQEQGRGEVRVKELCPVRCALGGAVEFSHSAPDCSGGDEVERVASPGGHELGQGGGAPAADSSAVHCTPSRQACFPANRRRRALHPLVPWRPRRPRGAMPAVGADGGPL